MRLLAALLILPFVLGIAVNQTAGSNIEVTVCNAHRHYRAVERHPWVDPYGVHHTANNFPLWDGFLTIAYRNESRSTATEIDFGLVVRGKLVETATDVGTFSPGVLIDHEFAISHEIFPLGPASSQCPVIRVKYANGAVWYNSRPMPQ